MRKTILASTFLFAAAAFIAAPVQTQAAGVADINAAKTEQVRAKLAKLKTDDIKALAKSASEIALDAGKPQSERVGAIRTLGLLQCRVGIPALKTLFADAQLADDARQALQRIPGPEAKSALLEGLAKATEPKIIAGFLESIGALKARDAVLTVKGFIVNENSLVSEAAQRALAAIGTPDGFAALAAAPDSELKRDLQIDMAAKILACPACAAGRPAVIAVLKNLSKNTSDADAAFSAFLLRFRYQDADAAAGLKSGNAIERRAAASFLNGSRDIESGKVIEKALASSKGADLRPLLGAVESRHLTSALPVLRELFANEQDASVKQDILKTIGGIGAAAEVAFLAALINDAAVGDAAKDALAKISGAGVSKAFTDLAADTSKDKKFRTDLLGLIQRRELRDAVPALVALFADEDADVRFEAFKVVNKFANKSQIGLLEKSCDTAKDDVKKRVEGLIKKLSK